MLDESRTNERARPEAEGSVCNLAPSLSLYLLSFYVSGFSFRLIYIQHD
jgi:hypothetical protein